MTFLPDVWSVCWSVSVCFVYNVSITSFTPWPSHIHSTSVCPSVCVISSFSFSPHPSGPQQESLLTVLVHAHLQALLEAARLALVPVSLIHHARARARLASAGVACRGWEDQREEGRRENVKGEGGRDTWR